MRATGRGRARGLVSLAVALWLLLAVGAAAQEADEPLAAGTAVRLLGGTDATPGVPYPLTISLLTGKAGFRGDMVVFWHGEPERNRWVIPLDVGEGSFSYQAFPTAPNSQAMLRIVLRREGQPDYDSTTLKVPYTPNDPGLFCHQILAVSTDLRGIGRIADSIKSTVRVEKRDFPWVIARINSRSELMPERWYGYLPYHAVVYDCDRPVPLSGLQRAALRRWVDAGGRLVLYNAYPERAAWIAQELGYTAPAARDGVVQHQPQGVGSIVWLATDASYLSQLMEADWQPILATEPAPTTVATLVDGDGYAPASVGAVQMAMQRTVGQRVAHQGLPLGLLWSLGFGYLILVSLVEYQILKRLNRLTLTWVTLPILVLIASVVFYRSFQMRADAETPTSEFIIRDADTTGECRGITRYVAQRNSRNADLDILATADTWIVGWPRLREATGYMNYGQVENAPDAVTAVTSTAGGQRLQAASAIAQIHLLRLVEPGDQTLIPIDVDVTVDTTGRVTAIDLSDDWPATVLVIAAGNTVWTRAANGVPEQLISTDLIAGYLQPWLYTATSLNSAQAAAVARQYTVDWLLARGVGNWPPGPATQALNSRRVVNSGQVLVLLLPAGTQRDGVHSRQVMWRQVVSPRVEDRP